MKKLLIILTLGLMFGQTKWSTRIYELDVNIDAQQEFPLDMLSITGYDLSSDEV